MAMMRTPRPANKVAFGSARLTDESMRKKTSIARLTTNVKRMKTKNCDAEYCNPTMK
jgi:hypothetical protein